MKTPRILRIRYNDNRKKKRERERIAKSVFALFLLNALKPIFTLKQSTK